MLEITLRRLEQESALMGAQHMREKRWPYADTGHTLGRGLVEARGIRFATLIISSGMLGGLDAALRALEQGNVYVGILKE